VRLKRLELSGFKTFAERTVIEFASQITGIVGPNGSGKSNIFDAVRWALGEGSLRALRSVRTEDIIFAGTERRRPLGMTEVTLTLDNEDGSLALPPGPDGGNLPPTPLAFAEVTVTRRAMRNAESEYFINGLPCRLRDIQSMFLGTGLGGHTYALITQGEVDRTLDATPEERRMILEEAAGLAKYKRRRHDAERRMGAAESTLLRVTDVLAELDVQTEQLAAQAETAERYQAQTRELRTLELSLQVDEVRRSLRAQRRVREHLEEIAARRRETEDAVRALAEQRQTLDRQAVDAGQEWEQIQRTQVDLTERRAAAQAAVDLIGERLRGVDARRQRLDRERARCRGDAEMLGAERDALAGADRDLLTRQDRIRQDAEAAAAQLLEMEAEAAQGEEQLEACRAEVRAAVEVRIRAWSEMAAAEAREAAHRDRSAGLGARVAHLRQQLDTARGDAAVRAGESEMGEAELDGARGRLAALRAEHEASSADRESLVGEERRLEIERERLASRLRYLEEARAQYRGYDGGAREILLAWQSDPSRAPGLAGAVADFLSVPRNLRRAVEAALGPALSALVVSSMDDVAGALALLGGEERGAITFVPAATMSAEGARAVPSAVGSDPAILGRAVDLVQISGRHAEAVRTLLADVLIVVDVDAASRLRGAGYRGRAVSLAGEVLTAEGTLIVGRRSSDQVGILGRSEEVTEVREACARMDASLGALADRRDAIGARIHELEGAIAAAEALAARHSDRVAESRRRLTLVEAESGRLAEEIARVSAEQAAVDQEVAAASEIRTRAGRDADALGVRLAEREAQIAALVVKLREHSGARRAGAAQVTELRVALTEATGRREGLQTRMQEVDRGLALLATRDEELAAEGGQLDAEAADLASERAAGRARCEALDAEGARLGAAQAALDDVRAQLAARRAEAEGEHREALDRAAALAEEVHKVEVRQAQVEAELGSARRRMEEEFGISFERAVESVPESVNRDETAGRIEALRGLIAAMGPVNLLAIEEHRQVAERAQALRQQMEDVQAAIAALRALIVQLEGVIRGQFDKTYHAVNEEFGAIFARLFGGGRAGLELVPGADGAEPGIDIIAQPPGKKLRSLGALSGGERVMVALALVFAMLRVRPSPFCVFDEVEAALDEANTRKVSDVLRELAVRSQIIIITHNKATMEASDALFGVTMEEPGVSHMVSVRLVESDPLGEPQPVG
jgi:chromosome segregation protein